MADGRSRFMMVDAGGQMQGDGRQMTDDMVDGRI